MNSGLILFFVIVWFIFIYKWYGTTLEKKIVCPDDSRETPAITMGDGVDYVPAKPSILFGHHFAAIAGAGPILGPIFATAIFGWGELFYGFFLEQHS